MTHIKKTTLIVIAALALQACAIMPKTLKAPCGPQASLASTATDPCSIREPINKEKFIVQVFNEGLESPRAL